MPASHDTPQLRAYVQGLIRAEKARQNLTFGELSRKLAAIGVKQTATNLSTKVGRGGMSAQLFVALLYVMGVPRIDIGDVAIRDRRKRHNGKRVHASA